VPTLDGVTEFDGPKIELSPLTLGVLKVPALPPPLVPVHGVLGETSSHQVKATEPVGARPVELPVTAAESVHVLPTGSEEGGVTEVVKTGVTAATVKHSVSVCWPTEA
jgi:hypothetical protein